MARYIFRRILMLMPILLAVSFAVFFLLSITPGDPATIALGEGASAEAIALKRAELNLDKPFALRYLIWLKNLVFHFDLGNTYSTGIPVTFQLLNSIKLTLKLASIALCVAVLIGVPMGIVAAVRQYSLADNIVTFLSMIGISMPIFWLGLLLIILFAVQLGWLPSSSSSLSSFRECILPAVTMSVQSVAILARMTRSSMLEIVRQDYIRTVRAKGLSEWGVTIYHALKNASLPILTTIGSQLGALLGGAVMCETIFSIPGVGRLMIMAIKSRDYPLVLGGVLFVAIMVAVVNLIVDILYAAVDPRIKSQYRK